ncbi:MAG TPA: hypothetical protein VMU07_00150 [Candidatus Paceibacterota bacterium]|nr:hypothetical protein [Candidatus Paceibacterota bacterium]
MKTSKEKNFIEQLQNLDEPMKRRVLVASTVVVMIAVVYVWAGYFNSIVTNNRGQLATEAAVAELNGTSSIATGIPIATGASSQAATAQNIPGFWQQIGSGFAGLYHKMVNGFEGIGNSLGEPKQYTITPNQ